MVKISNSRWSKYDDGDFFCNCEQLYNNSKRTDYTAWACIYIWKIQNLPDLCCEVLHYVSQLEQVTDKLCDTGMYTVHVYILRQIYTVSISVYFKKYM